MTENPLATNLALPRNFCLVRRLGYDYGNLMMYAITLTADITAVAKLQMTEDKRLIAASCTIVLWYVYKKPNGVNL